ncbi:phage head closure protein [Virgibacillus sp. W0430]|uniref:phage head closure protein n=1 Tax=Virgibacillus sp. W0430 TaxID=3391580 RepID=UPI003F44773F
MVIVQRHMAVDDGAGGTEYQWANHLEIEGTLDKLSGDEVLASDKLGQLSTHIFIIFEIVDVKNTDRFIIDNEIYEVKDVDNPNNLDRQLEITLKYTGERYEI